MKSKTKTDLDFSNLVSKHSMSNQDKDVLQKLIQGPGSETLMKLAEEISSKKGDHATLLKMLTEALDTQGAIITEYLLFAFGATAEMEKLRAEAKVRERDEQLSRLVDSAMDAVIQLDQRLKVTVINPAAEKIFGRPAKNIIGQDFSSFLTRTSKKKLDELIGELTKNPEGKHYLWIPGGLNAKNFKGNEFPAEATLSYFETQEKTFYTLILRNINERIEAEQKIHTLSAQTAYLRDEIKALHNFDEIIGESRPLLKVLEEMNQVAKTQATVLILGETGTGKELIARGIHDSSQRSDKPFIAVNCAAIPPTLMESELFGHEVGAFTGATRHREGLFALADGGTIFLDEIGELPFDLQVKLLRVLQENEFTPVGSSKIRKVDVRVIAATNRNLEKEVQDGNFREDLYYRINVFPIRVPPLRERGEDIVLLASFFIKKFSKKTGKKVVPLSEEAIQCLKAYEWPGNVRELENVIERALITARQGQLDFSYFLAEQKVRTSSRDISMSDYSPKAILTDEEMKEIEKKNLEEALKKCNGHVSGKNGAARLLGVKPTTLRSRLKSLGIKFPSA